MQNAYYELLKKYAKMMTEQEYPVGEAAKLMIETIEGVLLRRTVRTFLILSLMM